MRMGRSSIEEAFASQAVKAECKGEIRNLNYIRYSGILDEGCVMYDARLAAVAESLRKSSGEEVDITIHGNQFDVDISTPDFNVLSFSSVVDEVPMRSELMPLVLGKDEQGNLSFLDLRRPSSHQLEKAVLKWVMSDSCLPISMAKPNSRMTFI